MSGRPTRDLARKVRNVPAKKLAWPCCLVSPRPCHFARLRPPTVGQQLFSAQNPVQGRFRRQVLSSIGELRNNLMWTQITKLATSLERSSAESLFAGTVSFTRRNSSDRFEDVTFRPRFCCPRSGLFFFEESRAPTHWLAPYLSDEARAQDLGSCRRVRLWAMSCEVLARGP